MKIGILTQPLNTNYGGILQAYALKEVLQDMGHEVVIINRQSRQYPFWYVLGSHIKSIMKGESVARNSFLTNKQKRIISKNTSDFTKKYIPNLSKKFSFNSEMYEVNNMGFDVLIVGSDQCWRPKYSPCITNFFFDFAKDNRNIKRISYAASFGVDDWEFTAEDTATCKTLIQHFDAISVREDSAVDLVRDCLGWRNAVHVLDPTMLLCPEQYAEIVVKEQIGSSVGNLKVYVLDKTAEKNHFIQLMEDKLHLKAFEVLPHSRLNEEKVTKHNVGNFVFPNPAFWLRGFQDARFVITDSFHCTVFAILHNIPFVAMGNANRGMSRFQSLLSMFGLLDRLITDFVSIDVDKFIAKEIDWQQVNNILDMERKKAVDFLKENLD